MKENTRFTETYEYIEPEGKIGKVGISKEASDKLGDIYLIDLPEIGKKVKKGEDVGVIESIKAAYDIYSPVSGEIIEVNTKLSEKPELLSEDPVDKGWIFIIEMSDQEELEGLMDYGEFKSFVSEEH